MFIIFKLHFAFQRAREHYTQTRGKIVNYLTKNWIIKGNSFIRYLCSNQSDQRINKQDFLNNIKSNQQVIFFVFRDLHFIDWFLPIHKALDTQYPEKFAVIYVNFGSTLKKVGDSLEYLPYLNQIELRLVPLKDTQFGHFSDKEIELFNNFPQPDLILTTETIRQEKFKVKNRVYLPHYTVPKAGDTLPGKIKFNHVFLPTQEEFSYTSLNTPDGRKPELHKTGYPKMVSLGNPSSRLFSDEKPIIIFAPSLDIKLIQSFMKKGILAVFKALTEFNFVIKLHPTLSTKMHYLYSYLCRELDKEKHVLIDTKSNIQQIGHHSRLMIADFGSVGAEYKLSFGKRLIYLDLPKSYEGGADLKFRDIFADSITTIENLGDSIRDIVNLGDLSLMELEDMRNRVVVNWKNADFRAAEAVNNILA